MKWLRDELKKYLTDGNFDLVAGGSSSKYLDLREAFGNPELLNCVVNNIFGLVDIRPNFVAGSGYGGITLATAVSLRQGINLTLVRDVQKDHGKKQIIEGYRPKENDLGIVVDDVMTTGQSLEKLLWVLLSAGTKIHGCYVVVKRGDGQISVPLHYLYTLDDLT